MINKADAHVHLAPSNIVTFAAPATLVGVAVGVGVGVGVGVPTPGGRAVTTTTMVGVAC